MPARQLFYFGDQQYDRDELVVHLLYCQNKDPSKDPHILPILAPENDNIHEVCYGADGKNGKVLKFSLNHYMKAVAKKIVTGYHDDKSKNHPDCWDEAGYDFSTAKLCFGSLEKCIDQHYGADVQYFTNCFHDFNTMLAYQYIEEGTVPVTLEQIKAAKKEVEKPILEEISKKSTRKVAKKDTEETSAKSSEDNANDDGDDDDDENKT